MAYFPSGAPTLPYRRPEQLVVLLLRERPNDLGSRGTRQLATLEQLRTRIEPLAALAAYHESAVVRLTHDGIASAVRVTQATPAFLEVLGVTPTSDIASGRPSLTPLFLTETAFRKVLHGDRQALGRSIASPGGGHVVVVGTLPKTFVFPMPFTYFPSEGISLSSHDLPLNRIPQGGLIARLRPGVAIPTLQTAIGNELFAAGLTAEVRALDEWLKSRVRSRALGATLAAYLVLFACVGTISNLLIARAVCRRREFLTRLAVGASHQHLVRLTLIEISFISICGLVAGILLAHFSLVLTLRFVPGRYLALGAPEIGFRAIVVATVTVAVLMLTAAACSTMSWRRWLRSPNVDVGRSDIPAVRTARFVMIASQNALGIMLLLGGVLLLRSHMNLISQDTGFDGNVLVVSTSYAPGITGATLHERVDITLQRLKRLDGVKVASAAVGAMVNRLHLVGTFVVDSQVSAVTWKQVTPAYFDAVGSKLVAGRFLTPADSNRSGYVISESLAAQIGPIPDSLGRRVGWNHESQIVGVVKDEMNFTLDRRLEPTVFRLLENPWKDCGQASVCGTVSYVLRLEETSADLREVVRREIAGVDPTAAVVEAASIRHRLLGTVRDRSFSTLLIAFFAAAALSVCATGLFGVVGFAVSQRTREIAIRAALGAQPWRIVSLVLWEVLLAALTGLIIGLLAGRAASRLLEHLVYGVDVADAVTACLAVAFMLVVIGVAAGLPALRALTVSPATALRAD